MSEVDLDNTSSGDLIMSPKVALIFSAFVLALFLLLQDLLGMINGGGLFSLRSALRAADKHASVINVDDAGLRTIFILLCSILVTSIGAVLRANLKKSLVSSAFILSIVGTGFVLDGIYDHRIVGYFLASRGYNRCENGDFRVGSGKGSVWFDDYVLSTANCPFTHGHS